MIGPEQAGTRLVVVPAFLTNYAVLHRSSPEVSRKLNFEPSHESRCPADECEDVNTRVNKENILPAPRDCQLFFFTSPGGSSSTRLRPPTRGDAALVRGTALASRAAAMTVVWDAEQGVKAASWVGCYVLFYALMAASCEVCINTAALLCTV